MIKRPPSFILFPYTTLFRSSTKRARWNASRPKTGNTIVRWARTDRKSTRLNSSHLGTSYAVFCLKKKRICLRIRRRRLYEKWIIGNKVKELPYVARRLDAFSVRPRLNPVSVFFFNDTATTEIYTLSLHDALPI